MKTAKKTTFRAKMRKTMLVMGIVLFLVMVMTNIFNYFTKISYNQVLDGYDTLHAYYDHVETSSDYIKSYLSANNEAMLAQYDEQMSAAYRDVSSLRNNIGLSESWRYDLLENMLDNYDTVIRNMLELYENSEQSGEYRTNYDMFIQAGDLIMDTSGDYYSLITASMSDHRDTMEMLQNLTWFSFIIVFILVIFWFIYYDRSVMHLLSCPLEQILQNIDKIRHGKYELKDISSSSVEITQLCDALEEMAQAVASSIETMQERDRLEKLLLEQENENLKKDELLAQSELKMLQNQINPHFLFNTLNMIYRMSLKEGADDAADMLMKTSQLLRYGLDNQNRISSLHNELEMIGKYIEIQKKRLGSRVSFILECERAQVRNISMPGMILQPLVENALQHGLHDVTENGEIVISVGQQDSVITISVSDNGKGMPAQELEELILNDYQMKEGTHLGLYNVMRRLEMYFHEQIQISLHSDEGCGFEVFMEIRPARSERR